MTFRFTRLKYGRLSRLFGGTRIFGRGIEPIIEYLLKKCDRLGHFAVQIVLSVQILSKRTITYLYVIAKKYIIYIPRSLAIVPAV